VLVAFVAPALAKPADEARALYLRFVAAQNARDLDGVRVVLLDSPAFLWVSDGRTVWGREPTLARMASFQTASVWRVTPDLGAARAVELGPDAAYLHLPLELAIGSADAPDRLRFLVTVLCTRTPAGWRIASLLTTTEKRE
jgi:ketosteroid isomerase-like protein